MNRADYNDIELGMVDFSISVSTPKSKRRLLTNVNCSDNESESESESESDANHDVETNDNNVYSHSILKDDLSISEEIKHIDFSPKMEVVHLIDNENANNKVNDNDDFNNLKLHSLDISFNEKSNILDDIHVTKLNDTIETDKRNDDNKLDLNLKDLSKKTLQELCKERNFPTNGSRGELIKRLSM